jgi:hypothetical protein
MKANDDRIHKYEKTSKIILRSTSKKCELANYLIITPFERTLQKFCVLSSKHYTLASIIRNSF